MLIARMARRQHDCVDPLSITQYYYPAVWTHPGRDLQPVYTRSENDRALCGFFRLPFRTGLIRFYSVMVGCIGQPLKRLAAPGCGTANLIQSTAQYFAVLFGGLSLFTRIHPMLQNKSVQNPQIKSVSLFNVFLHRQLIATSVSYHRAERIKSRRPSCIVKFSGFAGGVA